MKNIINIKFMQKEGENVQSVGFESVSSDVKEKNG
jgi:hypothetical protein